MGPMPQGSPRTKINSSRNRNGGGGGGGAGGGRRAGRCCHRAPLDVTAARAPPPGLGGGEGAAPAASGVRWGGAAGRGGGRRGRARRSPRNQPGGRGTPRARLAAPSGWGRARPWSPRPARLGLGRGPVAPRLLLAPHAAPPCDPGREAAALRRREKREIAKLIYSQIDSIFLFRNQESTLGYFLRLNHESPLGGCMAICTLEPEKWTFSIGEISFS
ncbi:translation initiation factor IF-2-like [Phocoena sinus]|uniref:translation initiation factor IF-2-like n=1 Tax=Phocoena sinus TaxID=42100 RepID=UPI0013C40B2D|nr:translation initiation factor IF-2-like [Phocoena sinus]